MTGDAYSKMQLIGELYIYGPADIDLFGEGELTKAYG